MGLARRSTLRKGVPIHAVTWSGTPFFQFGLLLLVSIFLESLSGHDGPHYSKKSAYEALTMSGAERISSIVMDMLSTVTPRTSPMMPSVRAIDFLMRTHFSLVSGIFGCSAADRSGHPKCSSDPVKMGCCSQGVLSIRTNPLLVFRRTAAQCGPIAWHAGLGPSRWSQRN